MKIWKKIMIVALCVLAIAVTWFVAMLTSICVKENRRERTWHQQETTWVSEHIQMEYQRKGVRLRDARTGKYTTPQLYNVYLSESIADSLVVFKAKSDKHERGFLNVQTGKIFVKAQYKHAWNYSEGLAAVYKDGILSFLNTSGEQAFPQTFPLNYDKYYRLSFRFHDGLCAIPDLDGNWGLIGTNGEWVVKPTYRGIDKPFHGYRRVTDGTRYGLLTTDGKIALPVEYDFINRAQDGFCLGKDGICQQVDYDLDVVNPFVHDGIHMLTYIDDYPDHISDEYSIVLNIVPQYFRYEVGNGSGVIDAEGNVIIPAKYYMVRIVNENLFEVEVTQCGERFLMDTEGHIISQ